MSAFKTDGDFTAAVATAKPTFTHPFPEVNAPYILRQPFMQLLSSFSALSLNTAHPDYSDYKLAEESERTPVGAGVVTWIRTYAKLPTAFNQFETTNYNFIGFFGTFGINNTAVTGRDRFTKTVTSRVYNEFFRVGAGETYATPDLIPIITAQTYYIGSPSQLTDYLGDDDVLDTASTPDRTAYEAMISAGSEIVSEDSRLTHWLGAYYLRQTRYIKAQ
jgi:hypothetical protein